MMRSFILFVLHWVLLSDKIKEDELGRADSLHGRDDAYKILVSKPERMKPLGRPRCVWEDIKWILEK
jgi:hypothetical protein